MLVASLMMKVMMSHGSCSEVVPIADEQVRWLVATGWMAINQIVGLLLQVEGRSYDIAGWWLDASCGASKGLNVWH